MPKKNTVLKQQEIEDFDFSDMMEPSYEQEDANAMMVNLIEVNNQQMKLAFDLTKLIVEKNSDNVNEASILSIFKLIFRTPDRNKMI